MSSAAASEALLLELEGMKCGGCVRAVEQRLGQQPGVRQVSVNLLTRTAWVELAPQLAASDVLPDLQGALQGLGFQARLREQAASPASRRERLRQRRWWQRWRGLLVALVLLLVSGIGHLAEAGQLPWGAQPGLLASPWLHALVATLALAGPGRPILVGGVRAALAGMPGMDTLVGLGVLSAYGASLVGLLLPSSGLPCFFNEPVMLLGFVLAGRFIEERARWRTGSAIEELAALQPDDALLLLDDGPPRRVRVGGLRPSDRIRVLPGDRLPVDALVLDGQAAVDLSSLTGEPLPVAASPGLELAAGALVLDAPLILEVRRAGAESAIARIVHLVEQAQARKAPIQGLADRVSGRFTLVVLALALATFLFWWLWGAQQWPSLLSEPMVLAGGHGGHAGGGGGAHAGHGLPPAVAATPLSLGLQLAIAVLVVACPCALGLATPTAIAVGSGLAARSGLLFRGGDAIETAAALQVILFDKTGTLTLGRPLVMAVEPLAGTARLAGAGLDGAEPAGGDQEAAAGDQLAAAGDQLVRLAAALEQDSRHPLAHALLQEAQRRGLALPPVRSSRNLVGEGLEGDLEGRRLRVGRLDWLVSLGLAVDPAVERRCRELAEAGASVQLLADDQQLLGLVAVRDQPRVDAAATLAALRAQGLTLGLLSGDRQEAVRRLAAELGLEPSELAWELRPADKLAAIERRRAGGGLVAMVGDGINDAPALAAADLGIAVGTGTQIAQESADLVVMGDRLAGVVRALAIARRTMTTVRGNLVWAFGYNLVMLPVAAGLLLPGFGLRLSPPLAALLMALSSITVVCNALLLQRGFPAAGEQP